MRDDLVRDTASVSPDASGFEGDRAMETLRLWGYRPFPSGRRAIGTGVRWRVSWCARGRRSRRCPTWRRLRRFRVLLFECGLGFYEKAGKIVGRERDHVPAAEPAIT